MGWTELSAYLFVISNFLVSVYCFALPALICWIVLKRPHPPAIHRMQLWVISFLLCIGIARLFRVVGVSDELSHSIDVVLAVVGSFMVHAAFYAVPVIHSYRSPAEYEHLIEYLKSSVATKDKLYAVIEKQNFELTREVDQLREQVIDLQHKGGFVDEFQKMRESLHKIKNIQNTAVLAVAVEKHKEA